MPRGGIIRVGGEQGMIGVRLSMVQTYTAPRPQGKHAPLPRSLTRGIIAFELKLLMQ